MSQPSLPLPEARPALASRKDARLSAVAADERGSTKPPHSRRRRARVTDDERTLWDASRRQVKPLRKRQRAVKTVDAADAAADEVSVGRTSAVTGFSAIQAAEKTAKSPPRHRQPLAPLGRRERSQLSRGRKEIDARLDLHGMTQTRAHRALFAFLQRAHADGADLRARHHRQGQSRRRETERGVLRRQVPHWLGLPEFRSMVVGFEEAHIGHGGEGALYVRVRRARL